MIFLLEGVDRTGKSTLANELSRLTAGKIIHHSAPKRHPLDEYIRPLEHYLPKAETIILDRGYLGELVWPTIFGRESQLDGPAVRYIEMFMRSRGALLVYMSRNCDHLRNALKRDNEPLQDDQLEDALTLFETALTACDMPWQVAELSTVDIEYIRASAHVLEYQVSNAHKATSRWIGSPTPDVLLVGEQVGPSSRGWTLPFIPYRGTAGHFLMDELPNIQVAITNAVTPAGKLESVGLLRRALGNPPVVALGKIADQLLTQQNIPHESVPHPQYWRRFKRSCGSGSYRRQIVAAASR